MWIMVYNILYWVALIVTMFFIIRVMEYLKD
jgi:hypothetical protein